MRYALYVETVFSEPRLTDSLDEAYDMGKRYGEKRSALVFMKERVTCGSFHTERTIQVYDPLFSSWRPANNYYRSRECGVERGGYTPRDGNVTGLRQKGLGWLVAEAERAELSSAARVMLRRVNQTRAVHVSWEGDTRVTITVSIAGEADSALIGLLSDIELGLQERFQTYTINLVVKVKSCAL
jgi:hypothetical protein